MATNWEDVVEPQLWLGRPGDFDTPMLPGFTIDLGAQEPNVAYGSPGWVFVVGGGEYPRTSGIAQRRSTGESSQVRVDICHRGQESEATLVEVHNSRYWRQIVTRSIQRVYYERAVASRVAA